MIKFNCRTCTPEPHVPKSRRPYRKRNQITNELDESEYRNSMMMVNSSLITVVEGPVSPTAPVVSPTAVAPLNSNKKSPKVVTGTRKRGRPPLNSSARAQAAAQSLKAHQPLNVSQTSHLMLGDMSGSGAGRFDEAFSGHPLHMHSSGSSSSSLNLDDQSELWPCSSCGNLQPFSACDRDFYG
jgi:hypothetical protein